MKHLFENVTSLGDLTGRISNWTSFGDECVYDYGGLIQILAACLDNIHKHSIPVDFEELPDRLSDEEIAVLIKLADAVRSKRNDG